MSRRRSESHRWADVALRTGHLLAVGAVFASVAHPAATGLATSATLVTGAGLVASDLWRHGVDWFRYLQSWLLLGKLAALSVAAAAGAPLFGLGAAVVLASVAAHAPGRVRHAALWGEPGPCARCQDVRRP